MQIISAPSGIKLIQRGTATFSSTSTVNVTIASVNLSKATLNFSCSANGGITTADGIVISGKFSSATGLTFYRPNSGGSAIVEWEVVEYA